MKSKNVWVLLIFILSGIVLGNLLGEFAKNVDFLWFLNYGEVFGLENPITLDLTVIKIVFGLTFKIKVCSIIGMILTILLYKKI